MNTKAYYLSDPEVLEEVLNITGLAFDELEYIVGGRFRENHHAWPNQLKGEVVFKLNGDIIIRHHFSKKKLWSNE